MVDISKSLHRRSIRLKGYDYSTPGAYFVTLVTQGYKCIFGEIIEKKMVISDLGSIVKDCWQQIPIHFPNIEVEPSVVMPNHIHGIITIHENDGVSTISNLPMIARSNASRGTIYRAPTNEGIMPSSEIRPDNLEKFGDPIPGSIATIIRTYKAAVSRLAKRELNMVNIWQRNYYEHIVRDENELNNIARYILTNPATWTDDPEYFQ